MGVLTPTWSLSAPCRCLGGRRPSAGTRAPCESTETTFSTHYFSTRHSRSTRNARWSVSRYPRVQVVPVEYKAPGHAQPRVEWPQVELSRTRRPSWSDNHDVNLRFFKP